MLEETNSLIERVNIGDESALGELVARMTARLRETASMMLRVRFPKLAAEGHQTNSVLNRVWIKMVDGYSGQLADLCRRLPAPLTVQALAGIVRVATLRTLLDLVRHSSRRPARGAGGAADGPAFDPPSDEPGLVDEAINAEDTRRRVEQLHEVIEALSEADQKVLDLLFFSEPPLTQQQAAELLGVDQSSVSRRWTRIRRLLAELLPRD